MEIIPAQYLLHVFRFEELNFGGNIIQIIKNYMFIRLSCLITLELDRNRITILERHAFAGNRHLRHVNLADNFITCIERDVLSSLQFISLDRNMIQHIEGVHTAPYNMYAFHASWYISNGGKESTIAD